MSQLWGELAILAARAETLLLLGIVLLASLIRGLTGFGFAILAVPLLSLFMAPAKAVIFAILMQTCIGPFGVPKAWQHIDKLRVLRLSLLAMISTPLGVWLLSIIPQDQARLIIAVIALSVFVIFMLKRAPHIPKSKVVLAATGISAGVLNGFAAMPGPPVILYFVRSGVSPALARASMITFFFFTGIAASLAAWAQDMVSQEAVLLTAIALPVMVAGNHIGGLFFGRVAEPVWRGVVVALLLFSAIGAVAKLI